MLAQFKMQFDFLEMTSILSLITSNPFVKLISANKVVFKVFSRIFTMFKKVYKMLFEDAI